MGVDEIQMEGKVQSSDKLWASVHFVPSSDGRTVKLMDYRLDRELEQVREIGSVRPDMLMSAVPAASQFAETEREDGALRWIFRV